MALFINGKEVLSDIIVRTEITVGNGDGGDAAWTGGILRAPNLTAGTNQAGADLTIQGGQGTGTGDVAQIILKTPRVQSSGSTVHTLTTLVTLDEDLVSVAGDISVGANAIKFTSTLIDEDGTNVVGIRNIGDTGFLDLRLANLKLQNYTIFEVDAKGIRAPAVTNNYSTFEAQDTGVGLIEVARIAGAADPYFSTGGSQEFKFYNGGEANFGGKSPQNCDSINAGHYTQILEILGDTAFFLPFSEATGSSVTDWSPNAHTATTSKDISTWDTPPAYVGSQYAYDFDGVDEEMDVADHADFSTAGAMSCGAWVNMTDATNSTLFGVWDANSKREWRLYLDASDYPTFAVWDENNAAQLGRQDQTGLTESAWRFVVATFDGGTAAGGINIYVNGVDLDDADVNAGGGYTDQVDSGAALDIGFNEDGSSAPENYFDGLMWGPWMTKKELSADEVWNLYKLGKGLLDQ